MDVARGKRGVFEEPSQRGTCRIARKTLLDVLCHCDLFPQDERGEEVLSRVPVQIERSFPDVSFPGNIIHGGLVIAIAQDQGRGHIQNVLCPRLTPLSGLLVSAFSLSLMGQMSFSLQWKSRWSFLLSTLFRVSDGSSQRVNSEQRYPGEANDEQQTLKSSGKICQAWDLVKAHTCKNESHQHCEAGKD